MLGQIGLALLLAFDVVLILMVLVLATFSLTHLFGAPFVPTPKKVSRQMLKFADFKAGESFIDLGSGDGAILLVAAKDFKAGRVIGYEINPLLVWWSRWRAKWARVNKRFEVHRHNFFKTPVPQVDVVATYLWPGTMDKLRNKLKAELKPETRIISRGFIFKDVKPLKKQEGPMHWMYLYRVKDL